MNWKLASDSVDFSRRNGGSSITDDVSTQAESDEVKGF